MKAVLVLCAFAGVISGCSRPSASHSEAPLDIEWARRDQERRMHVHADSVITLQRSTLRVDAAATAEVVSALPEWVLQLRHADPAFGPESILWSPSIANLRPLSWRLNESILRRVRAGELGSFYGHDDEPAQKGQYRALLSRDSTWAADLHPGAGNPAPVVTVFDLRAGRRLQLDTYSATTSLAAMGWASSNRLVVASWGEYVAQGRRVPEVHLYDLDAMTSCYGMASSVPYSETH